jgi:carbon-monoxide dehydrogenase medium subunit
VRVGVTGAKSHAFRWTAAETALSGSFTSAALKGLSIDAGDINGDLHGSSEYRAAMVATMTARAVAQATGG